MSGERNWTRWTATDGSGGLARLKLKRESNYGTVDRDDGDKDAATGRRGGTKIYYICI